MSCQRITSKLIPSSMNKDEKEPSLNGRVNFLGVGEVERPVDEAPPNRFPA